MFGSFNDFNEYGQESVDAALQSLNSFERGFMAFASEWNKYAENSLAQGQETVERLMRADSVESALSAQSDFAQSSYDAYLGHMSRFSGLYARMAEDTYKPVNEIAQRLQ